MCSVYKHMCINIHTNINPKKIQKHTPRSATHHPQPTTDMRHAGWEIGSIWGVPNTVPFVSVSFCFIFLAESFASGAKPKQIKVLTCLLLVETFSTTAEAPLSYIWWGLRCHRLNPFFSRSLILALTSRTKILGTDTLHAILSSFETSSQRAVIKSTKASNDLWQQTCGRGQYKDKPKIKLKPVQMH